MSTESWLLKPLAEVVEEGLPVLEKWQSQTNLQGRIKNIETWILVQLNYRLLGAELARIVLTNGFFSKGRDIPAQKRVTAGDVKHLNLQGRKKNSETISADLSIRPVRLASGNQDESWITELKTGLAKGEILDDLKLVRFYWKKGIAERAELGWVILMPEDEEKRRSAEKTFKSICDEMKKVEFGSCRVLERRFGKKGWLVSVVAVPTT